MASASGDGDLASDHDIEDVTGSSGLPEDDPDLAGYVRVRDLRPPPSDLRRAIEDAIWIWPVALPVPSAEPAVLLFIRRDPDRHAEFRANPACLSCTLPGSPDAKYWGEVGVLCVVHEAQARRRAAERTEAFGPAGLLGALATHLSAFVASPQGRAFDRWSRSLRPQKRGPKKGSHRDPTMVNRVAELEQEDQRTGARRSIEVKAGLAATTAKTYKAIRDGQPRTK